MARGDEGSDDEELLSQGEGEMEDDDELIDMVEELVLHEAYQSGEPSEGDVLEEGAENHLSMEEYVPLPRSSSFSPQKRQRSVAY